VLLLLHVLQSPDSPCSKRLLFAATPSTKQLQAAKEDTSGDSSNGRVAAMLDHNHVFKRSHTTDLSIAAGEALQQMVQALTVYATTSSSADTPLTCQLQQVRHMHRGSCLG
jgi:hypothetical protein